jgi:hypothetical protein
VHVPEHEARITVEVQAEVHQGHRPNNIPEETSHPPSAGELLDNRTAQWVLKVDLDLTPPLYASPIVGLTSGSCTSSPGRRKWTPDENQEFCENYNALILLAREKTAKHINSGKESTDHYKSAKTHIHGSPWIFCRRVTLPLVHDFSKTLV